MRELRCLLIFVIISAVFVPYNVESHSADTFTVVIKEDGLTPSSPQLLYNDSVVWHNTDNSENITHRIVYDADGDGLYNGTLDWDSGILYPECDSENENDSEDCNITFQIWFNGTRGIGEYSYQDILSDGTIYNGTITVTEDVHTESLPEIGGSYGVFDDDEEEEEIKVNQSDVDESKKFLLILGMISGTGALLLIILLVRKNMLT